MISFYIVCLGYDEASCFSLFYCLLTAPVYLSHVCMMLVAYLCILLTTKLFPFYYILSL